MRSNIETLKDRHSRYMKINDLMNKFLLSMKDSHRDSIEITLTKQECIDIANATGDMSTVLMREIREKAKGLKQQSLADIKKANANIDFANQILGEK